MTDNEIRVAIAEACGWKRHPNADWMRHNIHVWFNPLGDRAELPDYLNDLNACAEFERTLPDEERMSYGKQLQRVLLTSAEENAWLLSATARQRCEAFLRVKGLWRE